MIDHVGIKVKDLAASTAFYKSALEPLGWSQTYADDTCVGLAAPEGSALWLYPAGRAKPGGMHLALRAKNRQAVQAFHRAALQHGGHDNGAPGPRPDYGETYYAAFVIDPDGNNVEAVIT